MSLLYLTVATEVLDVLEDLRWPKGKAGNSTQALQALTLLGPLFSCRQGHFCHG